MKLKAGNKIIPLFEKKKALPVQRPNFSGTNPNLSRPNQPFQKSIISSTKPNYPGQMPVFKPGPSTYPGIKKEKPKDITEIIANLPKDELYSYVSIIVGLIFIFIGILMLLF